MSTYTQDQTESSTNNSNVQRSIMVIALLFVTATLVWFAMSSGLISRNNTALANARTAWDTQMPDSYSYDLQVSCFCFPDMTRSVTIVVADGVAQSVTYVDDGTAADLDLFASYATVDKLLERLERIQAEGPATFDVTFDEQYGVPQSVSIDIDEMMADEEIYYTINNFEVLR
ncbi:MAG: DUF6174 domain-containing protein [Candidatus Promineifilaceae bacterium]